MVEDPWLPESETARSLASDPAFYFSDLRNSFCQYAIEFDDLQGTLAAKGFNKLPANCYCRVYDRARPIATR